MANHLWMSPRCFPSTVRLALALAVFATLIPSGASAQAGMAVQADFVVGRHRVEIRADFPIVTSGWSSVGVTVSTTADARVYWRRSGRTGSQWRYAYGRLKVEYEPLTETMRLRGRMNEWGLSGGIVKLNIVVRGEADPFAGANVATPSPTWLRAGASASAGVRWIGTSSGTVSSSLGRIKKATGSGTWHVAAGASRYVP